MHVCICLSVCVYVSSMSMYIYIYYVYIYISIRSSLSACLSVRLSAFLAGCLSVCLCASQPVLSVCLSYLSFLSYPYLPDSSFLCVLSVFYSYLYIIYIYTMPRFSPIVSIVLLSHQHLPNSSIYRSISVSTFCSIKSYSTLCILSIPPCHVYIRYLYISCVQFGWTESRGPAA